MHAPSKKKPGRARRALKVGLKIVGGLVAAVVALALAAVVAITNTAAGRGWLIAKVNGALGPSFKGIVAVDGLGGLGLGGLSGLNLTVADAGGPLLRARNVGVSIDALGVLKGALFAKTERRIPVGGVTVDEVYADVSADAAGGLRLAQAFESTSPPSPEAPSKPVHLVLGSVRVGTIFVRGEPTPSFRADADATGLDASLDILGSAGTLELRSLHVVARQLPRAGRAEGDLTAAVAWGEGDPAGRGSFRGDVGGLAVSAEGRSERSGFVAARAEIAPAGAARWLAIAPEMPLTGSLGVRARAEGPRDAIAFDVEALVDEGAVRAKGQVGLVGDPRVEGRVELVRLSPRSFASTAPMLTLDGAADGQWSFAPGGGGKAHVALSTDGGGGLPKAALDADVAGTLEALEGRAKLDAEGAVLEADVTMKAADGGQVVRGRAKLSAGDLGRFPLLGLKSGSVRADAEGSFATAGQAVEAKANVEARGVARGTEAVKSLSVGADVTGVASALRVGLTARAAGVAAAGYRVGDSVAASTTLRVGEGVSVNDLRLSLRSGAQEAKLAVASVDAGGGRVDVRGVSFESGASRLQADVRLVPGSVKARAACRDLDLAKLARLVSPPPAVMGEVSCDVDAEAGPGGVRGKAHIAFRHLDVPKVDAFEGELDVDGEGRKVRLAARARAKHLGEFAVRDAEVELGRGTALGPDAWKGATGVASVTAKVPLPEASAVFDPQGAGPRINAGVVSLSASLRRDDVARPPSVAAEVATEGVVLELPDGPLGGVDARAALRFDGAGRGAYVGVELSDRGGTLVTVEASGEVPAPLLRGEGEPKDLALSTPFELSVQVPERRVRDLPFAGRYARGDEKVNLALSWSGSLRKPALDLKACLADVAPPEGGDRFALNVASTYDGRKVGLAARVRTARREVADLSAAVDVVVADLLNRGADAAWTASADARFHDAPLSALPPVSGRAWGGKLNGELSLRDLRRDAQARGWIVAEGLSLGDAAYDAVSLEVELSRGMARALAQVRQKQGGATLEAEVPATWGRELAPTPDLMAGWRARATARALRVALFGAFAPAAVTDLDGIVDVDATVEAKNGGAPTGEARVALSKGRAYVVALGQGFRQIEARASLARDGRLDVTGLSARGSTGRVTGSASGRVSATGDAAIKGSLEIARTEPLPVTFEGESLGEASGTIDLSARVDKAARRTDVGINVRSLYMRLSETSAHSLQSLEPAEDVRIGVRPKGGAFAPVALTKPKKEEEAPAPPSSPSTLHVTLGFGDVLIVRGTEVRVGLRGQLAATMAEKMALEGQINLRQGGFFEVQGRRFRVENGTVSFGGGEVTDAVVIATASWGAPDGTKVYADFVGPVGTGRLTLRSEPARSPNEIVALLVFGTADSATAFQKKGGGGSGTGGVPLSAGGAIAAKGLNNALYRLTKFDVQTRVDTSKGTVRPEVVVPLSPTLSLEVSRVIGTPPPGQSPDRTFVSFEWRFRRRWSLETLSGDKGRTALDTFWTYSY
jgi:translocation and assembly module TamB